MAAGVQAEGARRPRQFHTSFVRCPVAFSVVAEMAAGDQVFPRSFPGARARNDMVEGHLARGQSAVAVLAGVAIAHQDVFARQSAGLVRDPAVFE